MMPDITYVNLHEDYAEELETLERATFPSIAHDDLYDAHELAVLARTFPEANFVAFDGDRAIGMGLGILVQFDFANPEHTLQEIMGEDGIEHHSIDHDWYYGTDISVNPEYRGQGIGAKLYELRKEAVRSLGKKGIIAGGVIPGYAEHLHDMTAAEYIDKVSAGELYDSTLTFQLGNGFVAHGPIPGYINDASVGHNAVLITWPNPDLDTENPSGSDTSTSDDS